MTLILSLQGNIFRHLLKVLFSLIYLTYVIISLYKQRGGKMEYLVANESTLRQKKKMKVMVKNRTILLNCD